MMPIRALIADDSARMRKAIADVLRTVDTCDVVGEAWNGLQAVDKARELRPDLIVLDVNMPIMGGMEGLRRLKSDFPQATVVMVSSDMPPEVSDHARKLGAIASLEKGDALGNALLAIVAKMSAKPLVGPPGA